jgi:hypothetical protein
MHLWSPSAVQRAGKCHVHPNNVQLSAGLRYAVLVRTMLISIEHKVFVSPAAAKHRTDLPRVAALQNAYRWVKALPRTAGQNHTNVPWHISSKVHVRHVFNRSIRHAALFHCHHHPLVAQMCCSCLCGCSLTCRTFDIALAECCHLEQVSLLAYSPLAMGLLTVSCRGLQVCSILQGWHAPSIWSPVNHAQLQHMNVQ